MPRIEPISHLPKPQNPVSINPATTKPKIAPFAFVVLLTRIYKNLIIISKLRSQYPSPIEYILLHLMEMTLQYARRLRLAEHWPLLLRASKKRLNIPH
ncbi:hypothetical protein BGT96224_2207 [Blumeria graminis f. sp. tritici 96224]|uniref:Uncharacterized protein n=2 Tax=Blumeria graminis f. sp. tritici 96224 TaxID=1268274 RepID=A0A656KLQ1_BLUGR|nr:hypothetical protein BGT96224_2207 [Blumeria graminis f. sp. tritici 96224]